MAVRYEADEYPRTFSARRTRPGDGAEHEMVTRLLLGHPRPIAKRGGRPILERVHRIRQSSNRWTGQYLNEPLVGLLSKDFGQPSVGDCHTPVEDGHLVAVVVERLPIGPGETPVGDLDQNVRRRQTEDTRHSLNLLRLSGTGRTSLRWRAVRP